MLTSMTTMEDVGYFNAASRIASLMMLAPMAYVTVLNPKLASLVGTKRLFLEFKKSVGVAFVLATGILLLSFLAPVVIPLLAGEAYQESVFVLQILLWGWVFFALNLPFAPMLNALEKPWVFALSACIILGQTYLMNRALIPRLGVSGAAASFVVSQMLVLAITAGILFGVYRAALLRPYGQEADVRDSSNEGR